MKRIDLHIHSTASDGTMTPAQIVALAIRKGLSAIGITDHDTLSGLEEANDFDLHAVDPRPVLRERGLLG